MRWFAVASAVVLLDGVSALACTVCESETGRRVRAGILNEQFGYNLLLTLLPISVLLGIVALIHFGWPRPKTSPLPEARPGAGDSLPPSP